MLCVSFCLSPYSSRFPLRIIRTPARKTRLRYGGNANNRSNASFSSGTKEASSLVLRLVRRSGLGEHRLPGTRIVADADPVSGPNQRQTQEFRIALDAIEQLRLGQLEVLQTGIQVGLAVRIEERGQTEPA